MAQDIQPPELCFLAHVLEPATPLPPRAPANTQGPPAHERQRIWWCMLEGNFTPEKSVSAGRMQYAVRLINIIELFPTLSLPMAELTSSRPWKLVLVISVLLHNISPIMTLARHSTPCSGKRNRRRGDIPKLSTYEAVPEPRSLDELMSVHGNITRPHTVHSSLLDISTINCPYCSPPTSRLGPA